MSPEDARGNSLRTALFSFNGRLNRARFWEYTVFVNIASAILLFVAVILFLQIIGLVKATGDIAGPAAVFIGLLAALYYAVFRWVGFALLAKRFHDRGRTGWFALLSLIPIAGTLWVFVDAYLLPGKAGENRFGPVPNRPTRSKAAEIVFVGAAIVILGAVAFLGRTYIVEPFHIPSGSNEPTIVTGDYIAVSRYAYRLGDPARGDLAVFVNPRTGEDNIKRIVGLPGDTVQLKRGIVLINGQPGERKKIGTYHERNWWETYRRYDDTPRYRYFERLLDGRPHEILGTETTNPEDAMPQDNTGVFEVPPGHFFAIGDNRDNSNDSRFQGAVPLDNLVGRAEFIWFSRSPDTPLWKTLLSFAAGARWERTLKVLN